TVSSNLIFNELCGEGDAVYIFSGHDSFIDDLDGIDPDPVDSAIVTLDTNSGVHVYMIDNLAVGNYTLAFTCSAEDDEPAVDDVLVFLGGTFNVTVEAGVVTVQPIE
ncbi:MAG: hypothetical protein O7D88_03070, partial [Gammaproteobacteria bacterium]|nr:hypothetical protein [Gammaproteobacteria bacterium]